MSEKTWTDQPDVVCSAEIVCHSIKVKDSFAEIRLHPIGTVFVTTGNLFGSQTVRVPDAVHAFRLLDLVSNSGKRAVSLPDYATLVGPDPVVIPTLG